MSKRNVLIVVDMQNDFISGSLGTKEAQKIVPAVIEKIKNFEGKVIYTMDTHGTDYRKTQEGRNLPVEHCMEETDGWRIPEDIYAASEGKHYYDHPNIEPIFAKGTFGSLELAHFLKNRECDISEITMIGLCTDICVITNALLLKTYLPEIPITVDSSCCAGVTPESHEAALKVMKSCQVNVI